MARVLGSTRRRGPLRCRLQRRARRRGDQVGRGRRLALSVPARRCVRAARLGHGVHLHGRAAPSKRRRPCRVLPRAGRRRRAGVLPFRHRRDPASAAGRVDVSPSADARTAGSPRRCRVGSPRPPRPRSDGRGQVSAWPGAIALPARPPHQPVLRIGPADPGDTPAARTGAANRARTGRAPPGQRDPTDTPAMVTPAVAVPVVLASIAAIDGALAGFRAATGRNGRIRKRGYYIVAMRRGLAAGAAVLGCLALVLGAVLSTAPDPATRYTDLTHAGTTMLWIIGPFAATVFASLLGYAV